MAGDPSLLMLADIGGYTEFMRLHRLSLAHSQERTGRLLEAIVKASPLPVVELEGDAVFFCAPLGQADTDVVGLSLAMHQAFHHQLEWMVALNMCTCDACRQSRNLSVKFVAHIGEVAIQSVGGRQNLVGVDAIVVHRMLKNAATSREYVLMTEPAIARCSAEIREGAERFEQDLEGLGPTSLYCVDLERIAWQRAQPPTPTASRRLRATMEVVAGGLPAMLGLNKPQHTSR